MSLLPQLEMLAYYHAFDAAVPVDVFRRPQDVPGT
jgi:hypothetical protein